MKSRRVLWGGFFIASALLLVVNQLGYFAGVNLWGLFFTILLIPAIASGLLRRNFFNVFFGIAVLLIIYAKPLHITMLVPGTVLAAALLLSIGFSILFNSRYHFGHCHNFGNYWRKYDHHYEEHETVDNVDGNEVNCCVSMGESCKYIHADSLETGRFECSLGYLKVYFDNVRLHPAGAAIFVDCSLGSMELYIPEEWRVFVNIDSILGNVSEERHINSGAEPALTINGDVHLANLDIRYI